MKQRRHVFAHNYGIPTGSYIGMAKSVEWMDKPFFRGKNLERDFSCNRGISPEQNTRIAMIIHRVHSNGSNMVENQFEGLHRQKIMPDIYTMRAAYNVAMCGDTPTVGLVHDLAHHVAFQIVEAYDAGHTTNIDKKTIEGWREATNECIRKVS